MAERARRPERESETLSERLTRYARRSGWVSTLAGLAVPVAGVPAMMVAGGGYVAKEILGERAESTARLERKRERIAGVAVRAFREAREGRSRPYVGAQQGVLKGVSGWARERDTAQPRFLRHGLTPGMPAREVVEHSRSYFSPASPHLESVFRRGKPESALSPVKLRHLRHVRLKIERESGPLYHLSHRLPRKVS